MLKRFFETYLMPMCKKLHKCCSDPLFKRIIVALTVVIVASLVISGVWRYTETDIALTQEQCSTLYSSVVNTYTSQSNMCYQVSGDFRMVIGDTVMENRVNQLVTVENHGTDAEKITVEETYQIGDYDISRFDFYSEGVEYLAVQGAGFRSQATLAEFLQKFIPYALIDPKNYATISGIQTTNETTISFTDPLFTEGWLGEDITLVSAEGTTVLDADHNLVFSEYIVVYTAGQKEFTSHYTAKPVDTAFQSISLPDTSGYIEIANIKSPYLLELACGYLMSVDSIQSEYADTITCEAFGDARTQSIQLSLQSADQWSAQVDTTVSVSNSSKAGATTTVKTEQFSYNGYLASVDGGELTENPEVTQDAMASYCQDLLLGTIMMTQDISSVEIVEADTSYTLQFRGNDAFANVLAEDACTTLYQSATILKDMAESSEINEITGYLTLDKISGFPLASGFCYQGTYTISELPYKLTYEADQNYNYTE